MTIKIKIKQTSPFLCYTTSGRQWCYFVFLYGRTVQESQPQVGRTLHTCLAVLSLVESLQMWPVDGTFPSILWTYAHIRDLLALEHVAKCVLMRNSWSGSAQIKDISVREMPPVFPSCSAASKWALLSPTPAGVTGPWNHRPRASSLPEIDRQPWSCAWCHCQRAGTEGSEGAKLPFSTILLNMPQIGTILISYNQECLIISKPKMLVFPSFYSLCK